MATSYKFKSSLYLHCGPVWGLQLGSDLRSESLYNLNGLQFERLRLGQTRFTMTMRPSPASPWYTHIEIISLPCDLSSDMTAERVLAGYDIIGDIMVNIIYDTIYDIICL
jgi:hypothetical protein